MAMTVIRPGMLTTVQDLGRPGHRRTGVPLSGAMDAFAFRVANAMVGNDDGAAGLEFTLVGPELEFGSDAVVALAGASCDGFPSWHPMRVRAGQRIAFGACTTGARGYLAIRGGIDVPRVLGSRSTYLRGGLGGFDGRALRAGDVIQVGERSGEKIGAPDAAPVNPPQSLLDHAARVGNWHIDPRIFPAYSATATVRVVPGAQAHEFPQRALAAEFVVSTQSDRMGVRLAGSSLARSTSQELLSSAVSPGTVQVPPDGRPVVLMADAQTIGGYPQIAHVICIDLPIIAQLRPGDSLRFTEITLQEAHRLTLLHDHAVALLRQGLAAKLRGGVPIPSVPEKLEEHGSA